MSSVYKSLRKLRYNPAVKEVAKAAVNKVVSTAVKYGKRKYSETFESKSSRRKRRKPSGRVSGKYVGRFRKPKKNKPSVYDKALSYGAGHVIETHGKVTGIETVWVGASTLEITNLAKSIALATLRKLFRKAGITVSHSTINLQLNYASSSAGFNIVKELTNAIGETAHVGYATVIGDTLESIAANATLGLTDDIVNYASGVNNAILMSLSLYEKIAVGEDRLVAQINMRNEIVNVHMGAKLVVQNRTLSANGADEIDVVDSQPLKGRLYFFKNGYPQVRVKNGNFGIPNSDSLLGRWSNTNVRLVSSESLGYDGNLKEPPSPYFWSNCSKSSYVRLEPGNIKEVNLKNEFKMYYPAFIQRLAWFVGAGVRRQNVGDSIFCCLEETLNSGSTNKITVNYELENRIGVYLTSGKVQPMTAVYTSNTINEIPA